MGAVRRIRRAIPPVINAIIFDEAHWWRARRRCHRLMTDFEARCAAIMGKEPKMSATAAATSAVSADASTIVTAAISSSPVNVEAVAESGAGLNIPLRAPAQ